MPVSDQVVDKNRFQIIPRTLIFVIERDSVLLLKGASTKRIWANRYNGIGGHIEKGEDVLSAARRELFEETGLIATRLQLCGTVMITTGNIPGIVLFVFQVKEFTGILTSSHEGELRWVRLSDLMSVPCVEDLPVLLEKITRMQESDSPFSAVYQYDNQDQLMISFG